MKYSLEKWICMGIYIQVQQPSSMVGAEHKSWKICKPTLSDPAHTAPNFSPLISFNFIFTDSPAEAF